MSVYENLASIWRENSGKEDMVGNIEYAEKALSKDYSTPGRQVFSGPQEADEYLYYMAYLGED